VWATDTQVGGERLAQSLLPGWISSITYCVTARWLRRSRHSRRKNWVDLSTPTACENRGSSLQITSRSFRYVTPYLWNQLHHSLRQPRLDLPISDSSLLQDHLTWPVSSSPLFIITASFFHFQPQNFSFSQILPSIDIWHLFGLISWISGLYVLSSFQLFF